MKGVIRLLLIFIVLSSISFAQENPFPSFTPYSQEESQKSKAGELNSRELEAQPPTRWLQVDPRADKYPGWSPYNYCMNNPLRVVDPHGDTVRIYTGENYITYTQGMQYNGNNAFVAATVNALNNMNSVQIGNIVLGNLVGSANNFNFQNLPSAGGSSTLQFIANANGGGDILAAALLQSSDLANLGSVSHELFHGYQHENGGIFGANSEVEAYLYSYGVTTTYNSGIGSFFSGNNTAAGESYQNAMNSLLYNDFNKNTFNTAASNFATGNPYGNIYSKAQYYQNFNPVIPKFYPLVRY